MTPMSTFWILIPFLILAVVFSYLSRRVCQCDEFDDEQEEENCHNRQQQQQQQQQQQPDAQSYLSVYSIKIEELEDPPPSYESVVANQEEELC